MARFVDAWQETKLHIIHPKMIFFLFNGFQKYINVLSLNNIAVNTLLLLYTVKTPEYEP